MENNNDISIKKYPKSKNNYQCIGPCYHPKSVIIHPINLEWQTNKDHAFCPIAPFIDGDQEVNIDECMFPTDTNMERRELEMNILTPYIDFNSTHFLKIYYKIFSFEDGLNWIEQNNFVPFGTKTRIVNVCLNAFGKSLELFDNRLVNFFIEYIKKNEIRNIYYAIAPYIGVVKDSITLVDKESNKLDDSEMCIERMNFMIKKFFDPDDINKFIYRYFKHRKDSWEDIRNHLGNMTSNIVEYIINKIEKKE